MRLALRIVRRAALLAMLGVGTSVAVAWALAAWLPNSHCTYEFSIERLQFSAYGSIEVTTQQRPGLIRRGWLVEETMFLGSRVPTSLASAPIRPSPPWPQSSVLGDDWGLLPAIRNRDPRIPQWGFEDVRGWPIPCLRSAIWPVPWRTINPIPGSPTPTVHGGLRLDRRAGTGAADVRILPFLPLWKGLAINTVFYALAWTVLMAVNSGLRSRLRRRRGLCPTCAYDLKHDRDAGCPECGWNRGPTGLQRASGAAPVRVSPATPDGRTG